MQAIHISYTITVSDFRKANYYGVRLRHRRALQIMLLVLGAAVLYRVLNQTNTDTANYLVIFLALGYFIWGVLLSAGVERSIKQYLALPDSALGCRYDVTFSERHIRFRVPERRIDSSYPLKTLAYVYELRSLFLFYVNTQEVYLLPKHALTDGQLRVLRTVLRDTLGKRFSARAF